MPTYEYRCSGCSTNFELFQKISDKPAKSCPECGGSVQRIISSGAGFLFKGSGFYATDYRSESYKKQAKEEKGSSSSPPPAKKDNCCGGKCQN